MLSFLVNSKLYIAGGILGLIVARFPAAAQTSTSPKPVFIHANCDGKEADAVLGSLKEQMAGSRKYVVIPRLDDDGRTDEVFEIYMHCSQRNDTLAVATSYGRGKCVAVDRCGSMIDASSIKSTLCESLATRECGKILFNSFDEYVTRQKELPR
jgi:hypothetical protein